MSFKTVCSVVLLAVLLTGCRNWVKNSSEKKDVKTPAAGKKAGEQSVSDAEMKYVQALRESDKVKREAMFKAARLALEDEAVKNKNYKAHLLLGYMADLGQGMKHDSILAVQHYRAAADSGMVEAKIALAEFWRRNEMFLDEAVKQITGIPNYEENPTALCVLGSIYYAMYENEKGFEILKKAFNSQNRTPNTRLEVLKIIHRAFEKYFRGNNYDAALKELQRSEQLEPRNYLTPYLMGLVEIRRGNLAEAEKMLNRSWKRNPAVPETYRELALLKVKLNRFDEAVDDAKTAYSISGREASYERLLMEIYILARRQTELLAFLDRRVAAEPGRKDLRLFRITILSMVKEYQRAYADLQILKKESRLANDPVFLESQAIVASSLGRYDEAIQANEAILKQGFRPVPALNLAELYILTNRFDKAVELLRHPDFKDQKEPLIQCVVPYLEACALLASGKNADGPVAQFKKAVPAFLEARKEPGEWDVTMFNKWLSTAKLPENIKKQIAELTAVFTTPMPAKKTANPSADKPAVKK